MPPARKRKPRSPAQAALGRAVEQVITERRGVSQEWVAKKAGLDVRQVNAIICGQANPTYRTLLRLCDGLRIPPSELMARMEGLLPHGTQRSERRWRQPGALGDDRSAW